MNATIISLKDGYTAEIATDEGAESPWTAWDCEPPAWVHSDRNFTAYGEPPSLLELFWKLPIELFEAPAREAAIKALDLGDDIFNPRYDTDTPEGWQELLSENLPSKPGFYVSEKAYFSALAALCGLLEIPYYHAESRGYSQGDWAECFFIATPEWLKITGVEKENALAQLKAAHKLWTSWAWGDVYGIVKIIRPDETECDDGSCWGFYGTDHNESGLIEHAENSIDWDIKQREKEKQEAFYMACADIVTIK